MPIRTVQAGPPERAPAPTGHYEGHQAESEYGGQFVNVTFGGPERDRLFVTATSSLYSIYLDREGAQRP